MKANIRNIPTGTLAQSATEAVLTGRAEDPPPRAHSFVKMSLRTFGCSGH
jgi:hypothetical protein